ncbi:MAG: hypothetical protein Q9198_009432 [Flavoplaca austrocitrina]
MNPMSMSESNFNLPMDFDKMGNGSLPTINTPIPNTANGLNPYLPLDQQQSHQPGIIDQSTNWMYNDPAFPITSQVFNNMASNPNQNSNMIDGLAGASQDELDLKSGAADVNWSDWDEMMKDLPLMDQNMELSDNGEPVGRLGMASGAHGGPVMGGMSNWW